MKKKVLSILLVIVMVISLLPVTAFAATLDYNIYLYAPEMPFDITPAIVGDDTPGGWDAGTAMTWDDGENAWYIKLTGASEGHTYNIYDYNMGWDNRIQQWDSDKEEWVDTPNQSLGECTDIYIQYDSEGYRWKACADANSIDNGTTSDDKETNHGYIEIDKKLSLKDQTVTVTVTPSEGYVLKTLTVTPVAPTIAGALKGVFSVSADKKVHFSQGNLQATYNSSASAYTWGFAANQYDCIGNAAGNTTIDSQTNGAVVDLFGWSTDAALNNWGIHTKDSSTDGFITGNFKDWGKAIDDKGTWCTLSKDEWTYLINKNGNDNIRKGKYKYGVTVCENANCMILAPDDFEGTIAATYDAAAWVTAEAAGLVCLPAAGNRSVSGVANVGNYGRYWSSTVGSLAAKYAVNVNFTSDSVDPGANVARGSGSSVRLVTEVITPAKQQDGTYQFTMPAYPVTVTAEFEAAAPTAITTWSALQEAIDATAGNSTTPAIGTTNIKLTGDLTAPDGASRITILSGKNITLDLNGHVLNANGGKFSVINVGVGNKGGTLTVIDSTPTTEHKGYVDKDGLWHWDEKGEHSLQTGETAKTIKGGIITGSNNDDVGGGVCVNTKSHFTMNGGTIAGNTASQGGGVDADVSDVTIKNSTITGNTSPLAGGVGIFQSKLTIINSSIAGNTASEISGGVIVTRGEVVLGGTTVIKDNLVGETASNLVLDGSSTVTLGTGTNTGAGQNGVPVPADGMSVGVTLLDNSMKPTVGAFTTNGTADDAKYFTSDSADYFVNFNTDHLELKEVLGVSTWSALQEAITAATEPTTIKLTDDLTAPDGASSITIPAGKDITLDLNGKVLNAGGKFGVIKVKTGGTLTVIDSKPETEHYFTVDNDGLWTLTGTKTDTTKTVNGGVITGGIDDVFGGVYVSSNGVLNMLGGNIVGNMGDYGSGVYVNNNGGTFTMNGGTICGNTADFYSGGVFVFGTFTMNGGTICGNSGNKGGGVYNNGSFEMKEGTVSGNTARYGGGVYNNDSFEMKGGTVSGNTASTAEGGIANWGEMHLSGKVIIKDNVCINKYNDTVNYSVNLATTAPINIGGALTGSEIYITHESSDTDEHDSGVLTSGFTTNNTGAKLGDFFTYDGPSSFEMVLNEDGELEVKAAAPTAITTWSALQDAINATPGNLTTPATKTTTIKLTEDLTAPAEGGATIAIPAGKNITLDLNGHVLNANGGAFSVIEVYDCTLTVIDSTPTTEHYFTVGDDGLWTLTGTKTENTKTVKGGVITGGRGRFDASGKWSNGGGVFVGDKDATSAFTMNGGTICGNTATYGGGVLLLGDGNSINNAVFNMNGSTVCGNTAEYGGGVFVLGGFGYLGGTTVIKDNFADRNASNLVVFYNTNLAGLCLGTKTGSEEGNGVLKPADGMNVGVTRVVGGDVDGKNVFSPTSGNINIQRITADDLKYFYSDSADYNLGVDTGKPLSARDDYLLLNDAPGVSTWADLQSAINEAPGDATTPAIGTTNIKLTEDLTAPATGGATITIPAGKDITLNLNGKKLDRGLSGKDSAANGNVIINNGTLTIKDSSKGKTGTITGGNATFGGAIVSNGETTLESGTITGCKATSTDYDSTNSKLGRGGAIYVPYTGKFNMSGGEIKDCSASVAGGAIFNVGTVNITGGKIDGCSVSGVNDGGTVKAKGGAVYNFATSHFTMTGGEISGNKLGNVADMRGAGVYAAADANITLGGTAKITGNTDGKENASNLFLYEGTTFAISTDKAPETGMNVGITTKTAPTSGNPVQIGTTVTDYSSFFFADGSGYGVVFNGSKNVLELAVVPIYVVNVEVKDNTIKAGNSTVTVKDADGQSIGSENSEKVAEAINEVLDNEKVKIFSETNIEKATESSNNKIVDALKAKTDDDTAKGNVKEADISKYLNVKLVSANVDTTENVVVTSMVFDVTPMATITVTGEDGQVTLTTKITNGEINDDVTFLLPVDKSIEAETAAVYHKNENGVIDFLGNEPIENYTIKVEAKSFSEFSYIVLNESTAGAKIDDTLYASLSDAVSKVAYDQTIKLLKNASGTITVSRAVRFTVDVNGNTNNATITAGSGYTVSKSDNTYTVSAYSGGGGGGTSSYAVELPPANIKNGKVEVSPKNASAGQTVTLTVTPDKGFTLETLTVLDKNGKEIEVKNLGNNKFSFKMPSGKVSISATFMEDNTMLNFFVDVKATDYFYDAVLWAAENGITKGTDDVHFSPSIGVTRGQVVTFLWRAAGCPEPTGDASKFTDVFAEKYYAKAVAWAIEQGITKGTSDTAFSPNMVCTRGQIVTFLARFAGVEDADTQSDFTDVPADKFFAAAVKWAKDNGVTDGTSATTFSPNTDCTRAQVVTFLYRWMVK